MGSVPCFMAAPSSAAKRVRLASRSSKMASIKMLDWTHCSCVSTKVMRSNAASLSSGRRSPRCSRFFISARIISYPLV
eukprot:04747_5